MSKFTNFLNYLKEPSYHRVGLIDAYSISIILLTKNSLENYFILLFLISGIEGLYCYSKKRECNKIVFLNILYIAIILYILTEIIIFQNVSFKLKETNSIFDYILMFFFLVLGTLDFIVGFKKRYDKSK